MKIKELSWVPDGTGFKTVEPHRFLLRPHAFGTWKLLKFDEFGDTHEYDDYRLTVAEAMKMADNINAAEIGEFLEC